MYRRNTFGFDIKLSRDGRSGCDIAEADLFLQIVSCHLGDTEVPCALLFPVVYI